MEKKHLIIIVALIFALVLVFGLVLELVDRPEAPDPTVPTAGTTQPTEPDGTTLPDETLPPETTIPTEPATEPGVTTAPTEPDCVHEYEAVITEPALNAPGYTTYTCALCGHSYRDGYTAALAVKDVVNRAKLSPAATGVDELDLQVEMLLNTVADGDTAYERLQAIFEYQRSTLQSNTVRVEPLDALAFAGDKVFASANEMVIAYEAYQILQSGQGLPDHYAALFMVLTRGMGLESYVVSGTYKGQSHVWNAVVLEGETYFVDTYRDGGAFLAPQGEAGEYVCTDAQQTMAAQPGFAKADALTVKLELKTAKGTETKTFTWSAAGSGQEASNFMCCEETIKCSGKVDYTLTVTGGSDVYVTDGEGTLRPGTTLSGTLDAGTDATLTAEDAASLMSIRIKIDN